MVQHDLHNQRPSPFSAPLPALSARDRDNSLLSAAAMGRARRWRGATPACLTTLQVRGRHPCLPH